MNPSNKPSRHSNNACLYYYGISKQAVIVMYVILIGLIADTQRAVFLIKAAAAPMVLV